MKKIILLLTIFSSIILWDRVPQAQRVMQLAVEYCSVVVDKSYQGVRKLSGLEKLQVFERKITQEQVLAMYPGEEQVAVDLVFVPHTLLQVRIPGEDTSKKNIVPISQEGFILWNLVDGEMVLNTSSWICSKGLRECLLLKADSADVQVMQTLAGLGGYASKDTLSQALFLKNIPADKVIKHCLKKKLIFLKENHVTSHLQQTQPIRGCTTNLHSMPVWLRKPKGASIYTKHYSNENIQKLAKMIFGSNFLIVNSSLVYVPVYKVSTQAADSSTRLEYVNAITGKKCVTLHM